MKKTIKDAAKKLIDARYAVVFTGAGISVESGLPVFRGEGGIWKEVDPNYFQIDFFRKKPAATWEVIKKVFYDKLIDVKPNKAHHALSVLGQKGLIKSVITQNIDHLHQDAGCKKVIELHGNYKTLVCTRCGTEYDHTFANLDYLPPSCFVCNGVLKPEFTFFNEPLPETATSRAFDEAAKADLLLVIGTRAEVFPANKIPRIAKDNGAFIIEINTHPTHVTERCTDIFLRGKATEVMEKLLGECVVKTQRS